MSVDNQKKFQAISANVFFPTMLIFLYYEEAYVVMAIYIVFAFWFSMAESSIYMALFTSKGGGKSYVMKSAILILVNGVLAVLVKTEDYELFRYLCVGSLIYSAWFGYFESRKYYLKNKETIDGYFLKNI